MKFICVFLACATIAAALPQSWDFSGNITDNTAIDYQYRFSSLSAIGNTAAFWISASVDAHGATDGTAGANVNTLVGQMYAGNVISLPYSWMMYVNAAFNSVTNYADLKAVAGGIGTVYTGLAEYNSQNELVKQVSLKSSWGVSSVNKTSDLQVVTMTLTDGSLKVMLSFIASNIVGQISYGNALVSPKSLECVIEIVDYPYADPTNHLELTMAVATSSASFSGNAMVSKSSDANVYFTLASTAVIDGTNAEVEVSGYTDVELSDTLVKTVLNALLQGEIKTKQVTVKFSPNAKSIIYDPAVGEGKILYGAAPGLVPSILLIFAIMICIFQ